MSVFSSLAKISRRPLYVPPILWTEEHLYYFRVSESTDELSLVPMPIDSGISRPKIPLMKRKDPFGYLTFFGGVAWEFATANGLGGACEIDGPPSINLTIKRKTIALQLGSLVYVTEPNKIVYIAVCSRFHQSWLSKRYGSKMRPSTPNPRRYLTNPYCFAILLAMAQARYSAHPELDNYKVDMVYLLYVGGSQPVHMISANFPRVYIEHIMSGEGELSDDIRVEISRRSIELKELRKNLHPFLFSAKQHLEATCGSHKKEDTSASEESENYDQVDQMKPLTNTDAE